MIVYIVFANWQFTHKGEEMEIEKGVPIPPKRRERNSWLPFFEKMEIGDSVFVTSSLRNQISVNAANYKRRHPNWNYTIRKVEGGRRLWRIEP